MKNLDKYLKCPNKDCNLPEREQGVNLVTEINGGNPMKKYKCSAGYNECPVVNSYNQRQRQ